jgi:amino acid transporter
MTTTTTTTIAIIISIIILIISIIIIIIIIIIIVIIITHHHHYRSHNHTQAMDETAADNARQRLVTDWRSPGGSSSRSRSSITPQPTTSPTQCPLLLTRAHPRTIGGGGGGGGGSLSRAAAAAAAAIHLSVGGQECSCLA